MLVLRGEFVIVISERLYKTCVFLGGGCSSVVKL